MKKLQFTVISSALISSALILSACSSTTAEKVEKVQIADNSNELSINDTENGFIVAGNSSTYHFTRNSRKALNKCLDTINSAASHYSFSQGKEVVYPGWREIDIIGHNRDVASAVTHVNCRYSYIFIND